jgi:transcriptional regulator with XRE-family HTH domain
LDPAAVFGQVLRSLRREAGLTQEQLSLNAGIERNFVSLIERGVNQPTIRVIFKLAGALHVAPSAMISMVEKQVNSQP